MTRTEAMDRSKNSGSCSIERATDRRGSRSAACLLLAVSAVVVACRVPPPKPLSNRYPPLPSEPAPTPSRALPMTMVLVGGAIMLGGSVAIAVDEDSVPGREHYVNSAPAGVAAASAGAVLFAVGYYLWLMASRGNDHAD